MTMDMNNAFAKTLLINTVDKHYFFLYFTRFYHF